MGGTRQTVSRWCSGAVILLATGCDSRQPAPAPATSTPLKVSAPAITTEATYLSARDAYARELDGKPDSLVHAEHDVALAALEKGLWKIIEPLRAPGFAGAGKSNVGSLVSGYEEYGQMDGLMFESADSTTRVMVTTRALFANWLARFHLEPDVISSDDHALAAPSVLGSALPTGAPVSTYAALPIEELASPGVVTAILAAHAQDVGPQTPDVVIMSVMRGSRFYFIEAKSRVSIPPTAECLAIWENGKRENENKADASFHLCYAEHAPLDPAFAQVVAQVRDLVALVPK